MPEGERAGPKPVASGGAWQGRVEKFISRLSDRYRKAKKHGRRGPLLSPLELHLIRLYSAYQYRNILPAHASLGEGAQNPRLRDLFDALSQVDAELAKSN